MNRRNIEGYTNRKLIAYSPLQDNQNWVFEVIYDWAAFEAEAKPYINPPADGPPQLRARIEYSGISTKVYEIALEIIRCVMKNDRSARFGIGRRGRRLVSLMSEAGQKVPNIFQLSSGETSLLNIFLSIVRDFDLSGTQFTRAEDVRGIVVVDEVDLHLHAVHQYEILPRLMKKFPRVQFIVTTHSPLFVLGMNDTFGEDGFAVYRMPYGHQISPEEFSEFASAYQAFTTTSKHSDEVRSAIEKSRRPLVFLEGKTDIRYLRKASALLHQEQLLKGIELKDGCGDELEKTWNSIKRFPDDLHPWEIVVVRDCEYDKPNETIGSRRRRTIPLQADHPIEKGIENLFSKATLQRAICYKPAFIDVHKHTATIRRRPPTVSEKWVVNEDEKTNLCDWLCENDTVEDFESFHVLLDLLVEALGLEQVKSTSIDA